MLTRWRASAPEGGRRHWRGIAGLAGLLPAVAASASLTCLGTAVVGVRSRLFEAESHSIVSLAGAASDGESNPGHTRASKDAEDEKDMGSLAHEVKEEFCSWLPWGCKAVENSTAADISGVTINVVAGGDRALKDVRDICLCMAAYGGVCLLCIVLFCILRLKYPSVFAYYVKGGESPEKEQAPSAPPETPLGWVWPTLSLSVDDIDRCCGLDQAMLIGFCNLVIKIFFLVGMPQCVLMPISYVFGGNGQRVSTLNKFGLESVQDESFLLWFHCLFLWYVVVVVEEAILYAQRSFQARRFEWLRRMPLPRATTLLVQRIPSEYRSDKTLLAYFQKLFSEDGVRSAWVVKRTATLRGYIKDLEEVEARRDFDTLEDKEEELRVLEEQIARERARIHEEAEDPHGTVTTHSGFVTFRSRHDAQAALFGIFCGEQDKWRVSLPPAPADVFWEDLDQTIYTENLNEVIGYFLVGVLYVGFVPVVVIITNAFRFAEGHVDTKTSALFASVAPTLGLMLFTSFLPTMLIYIFDKFFVTKAKMWMQKKLQVWYFIFQVIFVLLVTVVGSSLLDTATRTISRPLALGRVLAESLPWYSKFYFNFMVIQCMSHCLEITRYFNIFKFLIHRETHGEARARELAEPEDQDYYGIGSRSARWTTNAVVGLCFCSVSPEIVLMTIVNFSLCKLIYSYLVVFAETRKVDLGGEFWVDQLRHLRLGLWIYWLLTSGEITLRGTLGQAVFATCSVMYLWWGRRRFAKLLWEHLPFEEMAGPENDRSRVEGTYEQPELTEPNKRFDEFDESSSSSSVRCGSADPL